MCVSAPFERRRWRRRVKHIMWTNGPWLTLAVIESEIRRGQTEKQMREMKWDVLSPELPPSHTVIHQDFLKSIYFEREKKRVRGDVRNKRNLFAWNPRVKIHLFPFYFALGDGLYFTTLFTSAFWKVTNFIQITDKSQIKGVAFTKIYGNNYFL